MKALVFVTSFVLLLVDRQVIGHQIPAAPDESRLRETMARLRFAPMWMPVPKYMPVTPVSETLLPPVPAYDAVWHPRWQEELGLSNQQKEALRSIHADASAALKRQTERFQSLSPAQQSEEVKSWGGQPAPWRKQFERDTVKRIEDVLEPKQAQALRAQALPGYVVGLLYDAKQRQAMSFTAEQEDRFRQVARQRLSRMQEVRMELAEKKWNLLTLPQQAEMPEVVQQQGPTSAVLSIAWGLGFELDNLVPGHPMLGEAPVRERLGLDPQQQRKLREITAKSAARRDKRQLEPRSAEPEATRDASAAEAEETHQVEEALTPQQLTMLRELDLRRRVALALEYPEKRAAIGFSAEQSARLEQLDQEAHDRMYLIDREMLAQAMEILSPRQRKKAEEEIQRLIYGA